MLSNCIYMFQAFILSVSRGNDYITLFRAFQEVYSYQSYSFLN
jgi:hypothetical protein